MAVVREPKEYTSKEWQRRTSLDMTCRRGCSDFTSARHVHLPQMGAERHPSTSSGCFLVLTARIYLQDAADSEETIERAEGKSKNNELGSGCVFTEAGPGSLSRTVSDCPI